MKKNILYMFLLLQGLCSYAQKNTAMLQGSISHYTNAPVYLYKAYGDTLVLADTTYTNTKAEFAFNIAKQSKGLYKVSLKSNQSFFVLIDAKPVLLKTAYNSRGITNMAADSLKIINSEDNKLLLEFQNRQQQVNVAEYFLKQMMRLYPLYDPFHPSLQKEYANRYAGMDQFIKKQSNTTNSMAVKIAKAYYIPLVPDWKQPDYWRDSIMAAHYFDYFNPADSFYLQSSILPEKLDSYLKMYSNKVDAYGQPIKDELLAAIAAKQFMEHCQANSINFEFCLDYVLKKFKKEHLDNAFLYVYDAFAKPGAGNCESSILALNKWHDRVNVLRNVQIGSTAPDFELEKDKLWLAGLESNYTLLVFWATWCPHCIEVVPQVKNAINEYKQANKQSSFITVAISLDTENEPWQKFVTEHSLFQFLNFTELKGWKSEVVKKYNVYATPTMILLDKNKKIIAKPETTQELTKLLNTLK